MRIAMVCPYDLSVPGGVQGQVIGLARVIGGRGHEVQVIAPGGRPEKAPGVSFERAGSPIRIPVNGSRAPVAPSPFAMVHTGGVLRRFSPEVIHIHEPFVPGAALSALIGHRAPTVGTFHRAGAGRGYRALGPILSQVVCRLDRQIVVSSAAGETLDQVIGTKHSNWSVLGNGIDLARFSERPTPRGKTRTILFVGRHEERKGLAVLIDAFRGLSGDVQLRIVGDGPQSAALRRQSERDGRIRWLGELSDQAVAGEMVNAELFVAPSLSGESFGMVLLEAMAAGTAVIASDLAGYRLAGGDAVRYVPPGQAGVLGDAIEALLDDTAERRRMVEAGRRRAARHSLDHLAASYLAIYDELVHAVSR